MANQIYRAPAYSHNTWRKSQIFTDASTANGLVDGGVVPNVNDVVITWTGNIKFEEVVTYVDPVTDLSTLQTVELPNNGNPAMVGIPVGVANLSNVANLLLNPEDPKLSSAIDARLPIYGVTLSHVRIFLGSNITEAGTVVAVRKDTDNSIIDDKIGLVRDTAVPDTLVRYSVNSFCALYEIPEDTLLTAVFYDADGGPVMWQPLVVKHSHLISNVMSQSKFITSVSLESAYQNPLDSTELLVPLNHLQTSFNPPIYKNYQNGTRELITLGTDRVTLSGWGDYIYSGVGRSHPLVLTYTLATGELSQNVDRNTGYHVTSHYTIKIVNNDIDTAAKIFVIAEWNATENEYALKYHLYTGSRAIAMDVTDQVVATVFDGTKFGYKQTMDLSLDLTPYIDLPDYTHTSSFTIQLIGAPTLDTTMYRLWYTGDGTRWFGESLFCELRTNFGTNTISLSNYIDSYDEWLDTMYHRLEPIYDDAANEVAPEPEYVDIYINGEMVSLSISQYWDGEVVWPHALPTAGDVVTLKWYAYTTGGGRMDLAISNMQLITQ